MAVFATVLRALASSGARYLVIGGHAVTLHGHPRNTFDLDLLAPETCLPDLRGALERLGYREFFSTDAFLQLQPPSRLPPVDLMIVDGETFDRLAQTSETGELDGKTVKVPDALRLIALKLHAARDARRTSREVDWLDVARILQANRIPSADRAFQEILQRYGGPVADLKHPTGSGPCSAESDPSYASLRLPVLREPLREWHDLDPEMTIAASEALIEVVRHQPGFEAERLARKVPVRFVYRG